MKFKMGLGAHVATFDGRDSASGVYFPKNQKN